MGSAASWWAYLAVVLLSTLTPGPAVLLSMSNALARGWRASVLSSLGNIVGLALLSAAASGGIGSVLHASPQLFAALKMLGAAYLVYLGVRRWRERTGFDVVSLSPQRLRGPAQLWAQGALLALTNPKAILFFAALFPQFLQAGRPLLPQFLVLTGTLMVFSFCALMGYAFSAGFARHWLAVGRRIQAFQRVCGTVFVALGLAMLVA